MLFCKLLKEQIQDISLLMALLILHMMLLGYSSGFLQGMDLIKIHPGIFLYCIDHGNSLKRLAQIHLNPVVNNLRGAQHLSLIHI